MEALTLIHLQITHHSPVCSEALTWGRFQSAFFLLLFFSVSLCVSLIHTYIYIEHIIYQTARRDIQRDVFIHSK